MSGKKIFIQSIPRETASEVHQFKNPETGRSLNKNKVGDAKTKIQAAPSPKAGGLKNGLSYKPWIEDGEPVMREGREATLQDKMEEKWRLPKGHLTNRTSPDFTKFDKKIHNSYYHKLKFALNDGSTMLDLDNMDDELIYYMILDHKLVANSYNEWRQHKWPYAEFYIAIENESEELRYQKNERRGKALASLHSPEMTNFMKKNFVFTLELANSVADITDQQIYNLLHDYLEKSTFTPGSNLDKYEHLLLQVSTKTGREDITAKVLLRRALDSRVVYEKSDTYTWVRPKGTIDLGATYREALDFLQNKKKDVLIEDLKEAIKTKLI